jgi:hypothetical protein
MRLRRISQFVTPTWYRRRQHGPAYAVASPVPPGPLRLPLVSYGILVLIKMVDYIPIRVMDGDVFGRGRWG